MVKWAEKEPRMATRLKNLPKPVGYIDVDDAGFQELPLLVGTGHKEPPLIVRQAVSDEEHVAFGGKFRPDLPLFGLFGTGRAEDEGGRVELQWVGVLRDKSISNSAKLEKELKPGNSYLYLRAYRWATKNRADGGRWSKACQGLDVCLLGQQASALGVTGEGQGAETLQVQMALPAGWLKEVLAGNHLGEKT